MIKLWSEGLFVGMREIDMNVFGCKGGSNMNKITFIDFFIEILQLKQIFNDYQNPNLKSFPF